MLEWMLMKEYMFGLPRNLVLAVGTHVMYLVNDKKVQNREWCSWKFV